jgi:membrane protein DedA with SNARE-associated domain
MDPLSALVSSVAAWGYAGLFGVALLERFVPILPSYGMLVAIGIAAAAGVWSFPAAFAMSTGGGLAGCLVFYGAAAALGEARSDTVVRWTGRLAGLSTASMARLTAAGLLGARAKPFAVASACGIALWNAVFIAIGYAAALATETTDVSAIALVVLAVLLVGEGATLALWRRRRARGSGKEE